MTSTCCHLRVQVMSTFMKCNKCYQSDHKDTQSIFNKLHSNNVQLMWHFQGNCDWLALCFLLQVSDCWEDEIRLKKVIFVFCYNHLLRPLVTNPLFSLFLGKNITWCWEDWYNLMMCDTSVCCWCRLMTGEGKAQVRIKTVPAPKHLQPGHLKSEEVKSNHDCEIDEIK